MNNKTRVNFQDSGLMRVWEMTQGLHGSFIPLITRKIKDKGGMVGRIFWALYALQIIDTPVCETSDLHISLTGGARSGRWYMFVVKISVLSEIVEWVDGRAGPVRGPSANCGGKKGVSGGVGAYSRCTFDEWRGEVGPTYSPALRPAQNPARTNRDGPALGRPDFVIFYDLFLA